MDTRERPQEGNGSAAPLSGQEMLGPPPLIRGEDIDRYDKLLARLTETLQPADIVEEIWTRDFTDLVWEVLRLRRLKSSLFSAESSNGMMHLLFPLRRESKDAGELARGWCHFDSEAVPTVEAALASAGLSVDAAMGKTLAILMSEIGQIDRRLTIVELRRGVAMRELDRHRARFAQNARRAAERIDGEELKNGASEKSFHPPLA